MFPKCLNAPRGRKQRTRRAHYQKSSIILKSKPPPRPALAPYSVGFFASQKSRPVAYKPGAILPAVGSAVEVRLRTIPLSLDWERPWQVPPRHLRSSNNENLPPCPPSSIHHMIHPVNRRDTMRLGFDSLRRFDSSNAPPPS